MFGLGGRRDTKLHDPLRLLSFIYPNTSRVWAGPPVSDRETLISCFVRPSPWWYVASINMMKALRGLESSLAVLCSVVKAHIL